MTLKNETGCQRDIASVQEVSENRDAPRSPEHSGPDDLEYRVDSGDECNNDDKHADECDSRYVALLTPSRGTRCLTITVSECYSFAKMNKKCHEADDKYQAAENCTTCCRVTERMN